MDYVLVQWRLVAPLLRIKREGENLDGHRGTAWAKKDPRFS